jgi:hypothetical protein
MRVAALKGLQEEGLVKIKYLCRGDVTKGDEGLGVS